MVKKQTSWNSQLKAKSSENQSVYAIALSWFAYLNIQILGLHCFPA
jgi:hypothetical protein